MESGWEICPAYCFSHQEMSGPKHGAPIRKMTCDAVLLKSGLCIPGKQQLDGAARRGMGGWILWREASQGLSQHISPLIFGIKAQSGTTCIICIVAQLGSAV